jgi:HD-GYP domain-containing protein (c-di-GMP phosphodiesterase class II)
MVSTIDVEKLRVGMYIHLDGGWLSHPFKLSAFRIADQAQLATLRGLGLKQLRWSPDKSDLPDAQPSPAAAAASAPAAATGDAAEPADAATENRRLALAAQREAVQRCERHYGEAARVWREASESVGARPDSARRSSEALAQGMLDQLLVESDVAIRLVNASGGDRAAAHALNVSVISMLIGRALGLPPDDMLDLGVGALLHDVGKLDIAERLRQPDPGFSAAETAGYRDHVAKGVAQGRRLGLSAGALSVLAQHHENADGSGFPLGLTSDRMTAPARIVAIVNRYDNMCNPPPRVHPLTPHEAVSMLFAQGRTRFDSAVLGAFIRMMGVYPAGSLVQLTDDRFAMVVGVNSSRPLKPRVLVHDPKVPRSEALLLNLEEIPDLGIRRSLAAAKLPPAALEYLDPRPRVAYYFEALVVEPAAEARPELRPEESPA